VPVTVTVCVPAGTVTAIVTVSVEEAEEETETLVGFGVAVRPLIDPTAVRFTIPEKPFSPVTVIVDVEVDPA